MAGSTKQFAPRINSKPAPKLWAHQVVSKKFLKTNHRTYDTSDPGTGKTRVHIEAWADRRRKRGGKLLILSPKSVLKSAWGVDIKTFIPEFSHVIAYATNRQKAFDQDVDIYITNLDAVKWLEKQKPSFWTHFDTIVIDEITFYKHRTSARSKAAKKIMKHFKYRNGLTGTPNSLSVTDLWHQIYLLDDGQRLGNSFFHFRNQTQSPKQVGPSANMVKWNDKPGAVEAVASLLLDMTIRNPFEDCMDIPPNHMYSKVYDLPPKLMKQYNELQKDAVLLLQKDDVTAVNAAVLRNKLLQLISGAVYTSEDVYEVLDTGRYELIADLVEQRKHSVVFFNWRHQKDQLHEMFDARGITHEIIDGTVPDARREAIVEQYQAGFFQTILLHPQTGAHGLTLTRGTATIWSSAIYQPDFLKQGLHRIYRGGQTLPTETILIEAADTVEQVVYNILNDKNSRMLSLLELLRGV